MKIILLASNMTETGGIQRLVSVLANAFVEYKDIEIDIVNTGIKNGVEKFHLNKNIKCNYIGIKTPDLLNYSLLKKLIYNFKSFLRIKSYFKNYDFKNKKNIVIAFGHTSSCMLPFIIKKKRNIKLVGSQHNPISYNKIYSIIRNISLKRLDRYIVLNDTMKEDVLLNYKLSNIDVIENPNTLSNSNNKKILENKLVLAVGRLTEQKGFDILIDIWKVISIKHSDWKLKIVGDGPLKYQLLNQVKKLNLEEYVTIEGFTQDICDKYNEASIYAMTSRYEGFGLVLVEAQSCGLPTISFDCPFGPRNIINNNIDGYLINQNDKYKFIEKLSELMSNDKLREKYSINAIQNSKKYNIRTISNKWIKLFEEL